MEKSFIDNIRESFKNYSNAPASERMQNLRREMIAENIRRNGAGALAPTVQGIGTYTMANGWKYGPAAGAIGTGLGGILAIGGGNAALSSERGYTKERKRILDAMQEEATNQWTKYKNDAIKKSSGGKYTASKLAAEGKMVTDDGDIVDIDYDYYAKVPQGTLERVFGKSGAKAVQKEIDSRRNK